MSKYATKAPCMKKKLKMGWISNIIAGLVGSWLGNSLFFFLMKIARKSPDFNPGWLT